MIKKLKSLFSKDPVITDTMTEKEIAIAKGIPWVGVLKTHLNKDSISNGFFELDWNEEFITELRRNGYGFSGDSDESTVDRWFRELCGNVAIAEGYDEISTGSIDVNQIMSKNP